MLCSYAALPGENAIGEAASVPQNWFIAASASPSVNQYFPLPWSVRAPQVRMPSLTFTVGLGGAGSRLELSAVTVRSVVLVGIGRGVVTTVSVVVVALLPPDLDAAGNVGKLVL